jgi:hypothetical protein
MGVPVGAKSSGPMHGNRGRIGERGVLRHAPDHRRDRIAVAGEAEAVQALVVEDPPLRAGRGMRITSTPAPWSKEAM